METMPLYFIVIRHPEAYESPEDGDGRLTKMGKAQSSALKEFVFNLREEIAKDSGSLPAWRIPLSTFSSLLQRSFHAAKDVACSHWNGNITALHSLDETKPNVKKSREVFKEVMRCYNGEKIIIAICHGNMPWMLARIAYEHFVFPLNQDEIPEDVESDPYYACGYVLNTENRSIEKIEVGRKIAEEYSAR